MIAVVCVAALLLLGVVVWGYAAPGPCRCYGCTNNGPAVDIARAIRDQDDLDEMCGRDPGPPPPPNAPPLTARELITSPMPAREPM